MTNASNLMMVMTPLLSPSLPMLSPIELSPVALDLLTSPESKTTSRVTQQQEYVPSPRPIAQVVRRKRSSRRPEDRLDVEALGVACATNNIELVKILISEKQIDPNWTPSHGLSPLVLAVANGNAEVAWYLLENGAEQKACKEGITPLLIGSQKRHGRLCFLLLLHQLTTCASRGDFSSFRNLFSFQNSSFSSKRPGAQFYFDLLCFDSWGMMFMSLLLLLISLLFVHFPVSFRKRTSPVDVLSTSSLEADTLQTHSTLVPGPLLSFLLTLLSKTYSTKSSPPSSSSVFPSLSFPFPHPIS